MDVKVKGISTIESWRKRPLPPWISWVVFLCLPLFVTWVWGGLLTDDAYLSMRFAQTVGQASQFMSQLLFSSFVYTPLSPVSWLVLAVPHQLGWPVEFVAIVASALGWGVTAVLWQKLLREWRLQVVDWLIPVLLVVSPMVLSTQGSFVSWFITLAWLAILLTVQQRWWAQTVVLFLLLMVNVSITAVSLIVILLVSRIVVSWHRKPDAETQIDMEQNQNRHGEKPNNSEQKTHSLSLWLAASVLTGLSLLVFAGIGWQTTHAPWQTSFPVADWLSWGRQWLYAGEFVWLFVLFALVAVVGKRQTWPIAIWLLLALLDVNEVGQAVISSGLLFLAGVGMALFAQWFVQKEWFEVAAKQVYLGTVLLLCLPLVWVLLSAQVDRQETNTEVAQVGKWLRENSEANDIVLADPAVGYAADRTVREWNGSSDQQNWADFIRTTEAILPDYIITNQTLFWDGLKHLDWWRDRFTLVASTGELDIWQYKPLSVLTAETVPLDVVLENGVKLVGYQQSPQSIEPGEAVNITLHFQVDEPIGHGFGTVVWLPAPLDGDNQALQDLLTPRGVPSNWWELGKIVSEQFVLTTTEQIPVGSYRMTVSFRTQDSYEKMPLYQNEDSNPLDRIILDYVAIPWTGDISETAKPFNTRLGDEFQLLAAELPQSQVKPGDELPIQFFWEATNPDRPQHDYTIFVHLLNEAGEMVANADGPPQGGQYATGAWVPGDMVPDMHRLLLPPDLASGNYEVRVGAYLPETGERLPLFNEVGNELSGASLMLLELVVQ